MPLEPAHPHRKGDRLEPTGISILGGITDAQVDEGEGPLFGLPMVYCRSEQYYLNPYGEGYLCDYVCWNWADPETFESRTILRVEDCVSAVPWDADSDGVNELVVRTRWSEKPYTVYDWVDGAFTETWPAAVPEEVRELLVQVWEP